MDEADDYEDDDDEEDEDEDDEDEEVEDGVGRLRLASALETTFETLLCGDGLNAAASKFELLIKFGCVKLGDEMTCFSDDDDALF